MITFTTEEQRELVGGIMPMTVETFLYSNLAGNVEVVRSAYKGAYDGSAQSFRAIRQTALDCIKRGALRPNPRYLEAFQEGFSGDAAQKSGIGANENLIITQLVARNLDCTAENIRALIGELWEQLADNPAYTRQAESDGVRARRIAEMTSNGTRGFTVEYAGRRTAYNSDGTLHDPMQGQAQGGLSNSLKGAWSRGAGSKSFEQMTNEEVDAIYQAWRTSQDFRSMSKEQLREIAKGKTDIFGKNVHPDVAPEKDDRLHHPVTGEAFGQRSLIKYVNEQAYNGRNLISRNGRVVPRLRQLFEQTIRGEFG